MNVSEEVPQYLVARLRRALAEDPRTAELGVAVVVRGRDVFLTGEVSSGALHGAITEVVDEAAPQLRVHNETRVAEGRRPHERVREAAVRVAALGDIHFGRDGAGGIRPALSDIAERADVLLLAGDLTRCGAVEEAEVVAKEFTGLPVPTIAVLGNHDHHSDQPERVAATLTDAGITVLEGNATVVEVAGTRLGVAGTKGFGGGFAGTCGTAFGEHEIKAFVHHTEYLADRLRAALESLDADLRIALTHYAPIPHTLRGESPEIYPFLGSYLLGEAIDSVPADLAIHGHAHFGTEDGITPAGVRVRNVAQPVLGTAFAVYPLGG